MLILAMKSLQVGPGVISRQASRYHPLPFHIDKVLSVKQLLLHVSVGSRIRNCSNMSLQPDKEGL